MFEKQKILGEYGLENVEGSIGEWDAQIAAKTLWKAGGFKNQAEKLLKLFQQAQILNQGFVSTKALRNLFSQYNARILELRNGKLDGVRYYIVAKKIGNTWGFVYKGVRNK